MDKIIDDATRSLKKNKRTDDLATSSKKNNRTCNGVKITGSTISGLPVLPFIFAHGVYSFI